jgi:hypothetical protein
MPSIRSDAVKPLRVSSSGYIELAAVLQSSSDRDARFRQQPHLAAQGDELRADLLDGRAVVLAEIGKGFVIRNEASRQPHHLQIAAIASRYDSDLPSIVIWNFAPGFLLSISNHHMIPAP